MRDILDPADVWLGTPGGAVIFGDKRPVALDDTLVVLKDSGPASVVVLANDYDPEGGLLTLVSVSAALGMAVAETDGTVTYTPPPGIVGFDTVVYEIADPLDQRRTAQINVTISEPQLSIETLPNNTLTVNAETGLIEIAVTEPPEFAGSWQVDTADLAQGPLNLVPPTISGSVTAGQSLTSTPGLWIYDLAAGLPTRSWQWLVSGTEIGGATGTAYTVQPSDIGAGLSARETQADAFGQRNAESAILGAAFAPASDPSLIGWWDAGDTATITATTGAVSAWADKAGGPGLQQAAAARQPQTGTRSLNGLNVLDFDGGRFLERGRTLPASGNVAFHMAVAVDTVANAFEAVLAVEATNDFQIDANNAAQFDGRLNMTGTGSSVVLTGGPFAEAFILSVVFDRTGAGTVEVFVGGVLRGQTAYTAPIDVSGALHVMTNRSRNAYVDGAVAELILTADISNRASHHAYLASKWGLA